MRICTRLGVYALILVLWGCQTDPSTDGQPTLQADVFVRYLHPDRQFKAEVLFREGDTLETARPWATTQPVVFEGRNLQSRELSDQVVRYETRYQADFDSLLQFSLPLPSGKTVPLSLTMPQITQLSISEIVDRSGTFRFSARPAVLREGDMLVLLFSDVNNRAASVSLEGPRDLSNLTLSGQALQNLAAGPGTVYAVRKKDGTQLIEGLTAHWSMEYYSGEQVVQLQ